VRERALRACISVGRVALEHRAAAAQASGLRIRSFNDQ
jgi:hypothetical protein